MNGNLDIPRDPLRLESNVLKKDRAGSEYVRKMTHELRTPLNVIMGLCQYLDRDQDTPLNDKQREAVERMERNAHALLQSVNRLLENMRTGKYE